MKVVRKFTQRPVVMLTACETLCNLFIQNETFLVTKRSSWAAPFFSNLKTEIQGAYSLIGIDNRRVTREATLALHLVMQPAINDIIELKVQMDADIPKTRLAEIYNVLGFLLYYKTAKNSYQLDLVNLLVTFKQNITPELTAEITSNGIDTALITRIVGHADTLQKAQVTQETAKMTQIELTTSIVEQLNAIYIKVINICKISRTFYKKDIEMRKIFSYSKIVAAITGGHQKPEPEVEPSPNPVLQPN